MKSPFKRTLLSVIVLGLALASLCQSAETWQRLSSKDIVGAHVRAICDGRGSAMFAMTDKAVYRRDSLGKKWESVGPKIVVQSDTFLCLKSSPSGVLYLGSCRGLYWSLDNGKTWLTPTGETQKVKIERIFVDTTGVVFAGSFGQLFRSADSGQMWLEVAKEIPERYKYGVPVLMYSYSQALLVSFGSWFYRSSNTGITWTQHSKNDAGDDYFGIETEYDVTTSIWSMVSTKDFYSCTAQKMSNGVANGSNMLIRFSRTKNLLECRESKYFYPPGKSSYFKGGHYAGVIIQNTDSVLYGSWCYGITKIGVCNSCHNQENYGSGRFVNEGFRNLSVSCLYKARNGDYYAGFHGAGVFRSTDEGEHWVEDNDGMNEAPLHVLLLPAENSSKFIAGSETGVYISNDSCQTWKRHISGLDNYCVYALEFSKKGTLLAGTQSGVHRSLDSGLTWKSMKAPSFVFGSYTALTPYLNVCDFLVMNDNTILASTMNGVWVSRDDGLTWVPKNASGEINYQGRGTAMVWDTLRNTVYVAAFNSCASTNDTGNTWKEYRFNLVAFNAIELINQTLVLAGSAQVVTADLAAPEVLLGPMNGNLSAKRYDYACQTLSRDEFGTVYLGTMKKGAFRTTDAGASWNSWNGGLQTLNLVKFVKDKQNYLYALTADDGLYRTEAPIISLAAPELVSPKNDSSSDFTTISFSWKSVPNAASYEIQVSRDTLFKLLEANASNVKLLTTSLDLQRGFLYYWRVRARNSSLMGEWSTTRVLTIQAQLTERVVLTSPSPDSVLQTSTPELRWLKAKNATSYEVQVAKDSLFSTPVWTTSAHTTLGATATGLTSFSQYYWHVRALNGSLAGLWSETWPFSTGNLVNDVSEDERTGDEFVELKLVPNPAGLRLSIVGVPTGDIDVRLYDSIGKLVLSSNTTDIQLASVSSGVYSCVVQCAKRLEVDPFRATLS